MTHAGGSWPPGPPALPFQPVDAIRPSKKGYLWAGLLAGASIVVAGILVVGAVLGFVDRIDDFERIPVPGERVVELSSGGGYTVYAERPGISDGGGAPFVGVSVTPVDGGAELPLRPYRGRVTYTSGSREGLALWSVEVPAPGRYRIETTGAAGGPTVVAFGRGLGAGLVAPVVTGSLVGFLGCGVALIIAIVTGVRRGRSKRAQAWGGGGWGPPSPASAWGGGGWGSPSPGSAWGAPVPPPAGGWPPPPPPPSTQGRQG